MVSVSMEGIRFPEFDEADLALAVLADPKQRPLLVHCHVSAGRHSPRIGSYSFYPFLDSVFAFSLFFIGLL